MRVSTNPRPNVRLVDLPAQAPAGPFCLWELERQAAGIEPGELAMKPTLQFHSAATDPIIDVLAIVFLALLALDLYTSLMFLWEVAR